jgi:hypothetical protein
MNTGHHIQYLTHAAINKRRWDDCIAAASNGLPYAHSFYLDTMAAGWHALVLNDYEAVMPLPWRKKAGFAYLFQPSMTPILGVFGNNITDDLVTLFLNTIPSSFKLWDISLNHFNPLPPSLPYPVFKRSNFILPLQRPYEQIQAQYHDNIKRNLGKAIKKGCTVKKGIPIDEVISISQKQFPAFTRVEPGLFENLKTLYLHYITQAKTYCVMSAEGKTLSACAFLFSAGRAWYWLVGNEPEGRDYGASSFLLDAFIHDHANQPLTLDFEGSDDEGVAGFYKKFGASAEPFTTIYYNRLPFPFNLFKPLPAHYRHLAS